MDASDIIFLNGTALDYVRCALEGRDGKGMGRYMLRRYKGLDRVRAEQDFQIISTQLSSFLARTPDVLHHDRPDNLPSARTTSGAIPHGPGADVPAARTDATTATTNRGSSRS